MNWKLIIGAIIILAILIGMFVALVITSGFWQTLLSVTIAFVCVVSVIGVFLFGNGLADYLESKGKL